MTTACKARVCLLLLFEIFYFLCLFFIAALSCLPCWVKHEECMQVGCSEMSIKKSKCWDGVEEVVGVIN